MINILILKVLYPLEAQHVKERNQADNGVDSVGC
jgi:hypothetical protein